MAQEEDTTNTIATMECFLQDGSAQAPFYSCHSLGDEDRDADHYPEEEHETYPPGEDLYDMRIGGRRRRGVGEGGKGGRRGGRAGEWCDMCIQLYYE